MVSFLISLASRGSTEKWLERCKQWTSIPSCWLQCQNSVRYFSFCTARAWNKHRVHSLQLWQRYMKKDYCKTFIMFKHFHFPASPLPPLGHIWDVMLVWRKGNINKTVTVWVLCTIIMVHKDTSSSYRSVDCIGLWSCLVQLCLSSTSVSSVLMV